MQGNCGSPAVITAKGFLSNDDLKKGQNMLEGLLEKIKAFDAWDITTGSDSVLLGIIDTGI